jgi:GAF domain-containing protein
MHEDRRLHRQPESGPIVDPLRLASLDELEILDTGPEEAFDRITRLAARCLGVPVSLLSLLDHDRQFLKSAVGVPEGTSELPLSGSLCRYAIEAGEPLVVDDARVLRGAVGDISSIDAFGVVAYLGVPLVLGDGMAVGTLCAIDSAPRTWSAQDTSTLVELTAIAVSEIALRELRDRDRRDRKDLERTIATGSARLRAVSHALDESRASLDAAREESVRRMARVIAARSEETGAHIERMSTLCEFLALQLGLGTRESARIRLASTLHDVGKIAVPDSILRKRGALSARERAVVQRHVMIGHEMLRGSGDPLLELAASIALTHHERLDGSGYPQGLTDEQIPLEGRIAAVADVFDALTSDRVYRDALTPSKALAALERGRGTLFDPRVLDALTAHGEVARAPGGGGRAGRPPRVGAPVDPARPPRHTCGPRGRGRRVTVRATHLPTAARERPATGSPERSRGARGATPRE